jgi:hypothetical protein
VGRITILVALIVPAAASQASESPHRSLSEPIRQFIGQWLINPGVAPGSWGLPIALGSEKRGVYLDMVDVLPFADLSPLRNTRIRLSYGGKMKMVRAITRYFVGGTCARLTDLSQLRGLVRIPDERTALQFVRLRTSPFIYYAWGDGRWEVEIVPWSQAQLMPDFGTAVNKDWVLGRLAWDELGILLDEDYRTAGFEPAKVERVDRGFEVTRWIFWTSAQAGDAAAPPQQGVQRLHEFVGEDGEYRRSTVGEASLERAPQLW